MLYEYKDLQSRAANGENQRGEKGQGGMARGGRKGCPSISPMRAGKTYTLLDAQGSGMVRHIWCTFPPGDPKILRNLILRMYWDGQAQPSVEVPLGDFFGLPHGAARDQQSEYLQVNGGTAYNCAYIELGDPGIPHAIVLMPDWDERDHDMLRALGRALRFAKEFPRGANVSFVKVVDVGHVKAITYERGVEDFTLACGTGCGSIAAALRLLGLSGDELAISMPGGELTVSLTASGGSVQDIYLTGPTNVVCTGDILDEDVMG